MGWLDEIARYPASQMSPAPQPGGILPTPTPTPPNFGKMILNPVTIGALLLSAIPAVRRAQKIDPTMLLAKGYLQRLQAYRDAQREWQREKQQREWWMEQQKYKEGVLEKEQQREMGREKEQSRYLMKAMKAYRTNRQIDWDAIGHLKPSTQVGVLSYLERQGNVGTLSYVDDKNHKQLVAYDPQTLKVLHRSDLGPVRSTTISQPEYTNADINAAVSILRARGDEVTRENILKVLKFIRGTKWPSATIPENTAKMPQLLDYVQSAGALPPGMGGQPTAPMGAQPAPAAVSPGLVMGAYNEALKKKERGFMNAPLPLLEKTFGGK